MDSSISSDRDWTWLQRELLNLVREKLVKFSDYMRFIAICPNWQYVALNYNNHDHVHMQKLGILKTCHNELPMLMIQAKNNSEANRSFYSITDEKIYELQLPMPYSRRCFGSSYGWLFTIEKSMTISLLNPFSDRIIYLPKFHDPCNNYKNYVDGNRYEYFVHKGILLSDPCLNPYDYRVVLIYGDMKRLAYFQSSAKAWTFIDAKEEYVFDDVICYEGKIYAVNSWGELVTIDLSDGIENVKIIHRTMTVCSSTTYLVNSVEGDLLMVQRFTHPIDQDIESHFKTFKFKVFKWSRSNEHGESTWVQIKSLDEQALFLGGNHSISISTLDFPGCRQNCIYYTYDYYMLFENYISFGPEEDNGFFSLEDESFGMHYIPGPLETSAMPPIWIVPNFNGS